MAEERKTLFVTGKLAEPSLRRVLPSLGVNYEVAVMPITVAALLTVPWIVRRIQIPEGVERIVLPGFCSGNIAELEALANVPVERGPKDLRDLPEHFGRVGPPSNYGGFDIEILAEINHAPKLSIQELLLQAEHYRASGADLIDLGCEPGSTWPGVGNAVKCLKEKGFRISVDSFNPVEVNAALASGAELVLSVNSSNVENARRWNGHFPNVEVVAIPDTPSDLDSLFNTAEALAKFGVQHRLDPILEPIGFGFATSLGRYQETRRRFPDAEMMMGVGNLTELTDVDSAGVNVLLAGFCQELGIRSVLATEVINWGRNAVKEFDLARRLVFHAVREKVLPKRLEPNLVILRDPKLRSESQGSLEELARRITDPNYRIFAERGEIHILNGSHYLRGTDPFELFNRLLSLDSTLDPGHSFYLGYEFAKAVTALTLGKNYDQDRALRWGFLTVDEKSHRASTSSPRPV